MAGILVGGLSDGGLDQRARAVWSGGNTKRHYHWWDSEPLEDHFTVEKEDFERNLEAVVAVNMPGMEFPDAIHDLCHMNVHIFDRDHEQGVSMIEPPVPDTCR